MESVCWIVYLTVAGIALGQAALLILQTWEHRRYCRSCMRRVRDLKATGRAAVFAPCKGIDVAMAENLRALFRQDYPDYELVFIVESDDDPAVAVIRRVMAEYPEVNAQLVVAGRASDCGQKVHNLRAATAQLPPTVEYLAFVDSDAGPRPEWLRVLVARLDESEKLGAVTGYRWFLPERSSLANWLIYSINCGIMALLGRSSHYLVWGGSWGIRRKTFRAIGLREAWAGTLSDDLVATRQLRRAGRPVRFEPGCVVGSPMDYSLLGALGFVRRQYLVGRCYTPDWWLLGLVATTLSALVWPIHLAALVAACVGGIFPIWLPVVAAGVLYAMSVARGGIRQSLVSTYFGARSEEREKSSREPPQPRAVADASSRVRPATLHRLRGAVQFDMWAAPLVAAVGWLGVFGSLFGRHIAWRDIRYRMSAGGIIAELVRNERATSDRGVEWSPPGKVYRKAG